MKCSARVMNVYDNCKAKILSENFIPFVSKQKHDMLLRIR